MVKKHFERYKSPSWYTKFFFPLKLPLMVLIGSLYVMSLFIFVGSLILTQNPISPSGSTVEVVLFKDIPITIAFFLCAVLITAFNVKIIVLVVVFFIISTIFLAGASIMIVIFLLFGSLLFLPDCCCTLLDIVYKRVAKIFQLNPYNFYVVKPHEVLTFHGVYSWYCIYLCVFHVYRLFVT